MNVDLTPEFEQLVQDKVRSGQYNSASDVVCEALKLLRQNDELRAIQLQDFRDRIETGLSQLERGEGVDGDTFMQAFMDDLDTREPSAKLDE